MAKKLRLDPGIPANVHVLGISSTWKDYRVAQSVNKSLTLDLTRLESLQVYQEKTDSHSEHSIYQYEDKLNHFLIHLLQNRSQNHTAINFSPPVDYLLLIQGKVKATEIRDWLSRIRKAPGILMAQEILSDRIKGFDGLLTDLELHLIELGKREKEKAPFLWADPKQEIQ